MVQISYRFYSLQYKKPATNKGKVIEQSPTTLTDLARFFSQDFASSILAPAFEPSYS